MTQAEALTILKTGANVFLTGEPGSGKTHTMREYIGYLKERGIEPAVTASTGIAATHLGGMTIHSWSGIGIKKKLNEYDLDRISSSEYLAKRIRRTHILIIDEVSMLGPETLLMIDVVCKEIKQNKEPFGGLQVVFVGDFFQLPPISKTDSHMGKEQELFSDGEAGLFAYDSPAWKQAKSIICYLTEQHRQDDELFLDVLNAIRTQQFGEMHMEHLEKRRTHAHLAPVSAPKLFSHNVDVDRVNDEMLGKLSTKSHTFLMRSEGRESIVATLKKGCLSPEKLSLKVGSEVMFTKNNLKEGFVNGTLGKVHSFDFSTKMPIIQTKNGRKIVISSMDWVVEENGRVLGKITQLPLRLAWAITVHKSQGMSLDEAVMDLTNVFEFGQGYVALSRVRRLSGLHLIGWNAKAFSVHPDVLEKDSDFRSGSESALGTFCSLPQSEIESMHRNFLRACGGKEVTSGKKAKVKSYQKDPESTLMKTLAHWRQNKNLTQIAHVREMTEGTILAHIEQLVASGLIPKGDAKRLLTKRIGVLLPGINRIFHALGTEKLKPVFDEGKGAYTYDDLRIARILFQ